MKASFAQESLPKKAPYKINARKTNAPWQNRHTCILNISIGNEMHNGEKFESLLDWANNHFDKVVISLADVLYRHNIMWQEEIAEVTALKRAFSAGDKWLEDNIAAIKKWGGGKLEIYRWEDWLHHQDFPLTYKNILDFYNSDKGFCEAVGKDVEEFMARGGRDLSNTYAREKSRDFLLEEASVYILAARDYNPVRVYPGDDLETIKYLSQPDMPEHIQGLEQAPLVSVYTDRRRARQPLAHAHKNTLLENNSF